MKLLLDTEILSTVHTPLSAQMAQFALKPYRYLFEGRTILINEANRPKQIQKVHPSFAEKNMFVTALAVAALVPGLICGVLLRLFAVILGDYKEMRSIVEQFYQQRLVLPQPPPNVNLEQYREQILPLSNQLRDRIGQDSAIWQNPEFVQDFSNAMENAYRYSEIYFRQLSQECNADPRAMVDRMILQPQNDTVGNRQNFCHTFFYLPLLYTQARGCVSHITTQERERYGMEDDEPSFLRPAPSLSEAQQAPYFQPGTPQYRWRELHNAFCDKLDALKLRPLLNGIQNGDKRFSRWAQHDVKMVRKYGPKDTLPT